MPVDNQPNTQEDDAAVHLAGVFDFSMWLASPAQQFELFISNLMPWRHSNVEINFHPCIKRQSWNSGASA